MALPTTTAEQREEVLALLLEGELSQKAIAAQLGLTKNIVAGIADRAYMNRPFSTMFERLDSLNSKMDGVLAEFRANRHRYHTRG